MRQPPLPRGFALVSAVLFLIVLTVLAMVMFRTSSTQGKISGNTLEHERSLQVAESALRYGEWLLVQNPVPALNPNCTALLNLNNGDKPVICGNALANPTAVPWPAGMQYLPRGMTVQAGGGLVSTAQGGANADVNYARLPMLYIFQIGADPNANGRTLYRVTGAGFGGDANSVSVLQSVVSVGSGS